MNKEFNFSKNVNETGKERMKYRESVHDLLKSLINSTIKRESEINKSNKRLRVNLALFYGIAGSGKTYLKKELEKIGYSTYDMDDYGEIIKVKQKRTLPAPWDYQRWVWNIDKIPSDEFGLFFGVSDNMPEVEKMFKFKILLRPVWSNKFNEMTKLENARRKKLGQGLIDPGLIQINTEALKRVVKPLVTIKYWIFSIRSILPDVIKMFPDKGMKVVSNTEGFVKMYRGEK